MRVFAAGIVTETNTFSPMPTGMADFEIQRDLASLREGGEMAVFKERALARNWGFAMSLYAFAQPAGLTVKRVYESLRDEVLADLEAALPVSVVLLPLHGAMVAEGYDDCEGDLIARVRARVGPKTVIGVTLDLHCHLSSAMLEHADLMVIYKEYPHTDMAERAGELFELAVATAEGTLRPRMAMADCRMMGLYPTTAQPMRAFVDAMRAAEGKGGVLSLSLAHGFPWGDVPDCGARMLAITDGDAGGAARQAESWGRRFFDLRREVSLQPLTMDEALDRALASRERPVVVADQADNPGGGAPGDATFVLRALLARGVREVGLAMIWDPTVVALAKAAGEGARLTLRLGGKLGPSSGDPLDLEAEVIGVREHMTQAWPQTQGALTMPCGDAAALRIGGVDVIVSTRRTQVFSPQVFSHFGIDPSAKRLLVVKSMQHFYAGFAPIAAEVLYMAAPGAVAPIMTAIPFRRADLAKYPWQDDPFGDAS